MRFHKKYEKGCLFFLLYFLLAVVSPVSHCHAEHGLNEKSACGADFDVKQELECPCCELHEKGHADGHHIHFIFDGQKASVRQLSPERSAFQQHIAVSEEKVSKFKGPLSGGLSFFEDLKSALKGFRSSFSGLSPPLFNLS